MNNKLIAMLNNEFDVEIFNVREFTGIWKYQFDFAYSVFPREYQKFKLDEDDRYIYKCTVMRDEHFSGALARTIKEINDGV